MRIQVQSLIPLIQVFDMPTSITFYRDIIGFEVAMQSRPGDHFDWALLKMGDASLMLNTAFESGRRPAALDPTRRDAHRDTTFYFYCPNVDETYELLRSKGIAVKKPIVREYGMKQLTVTDPDGYELCFQYPSEKAEVSRQHQFCRGGRDCSRFGG